MILNGIMRIVHFITILITVMRMVKQVRTRIQESSKLLEIERHVRFSHSALTTLTP
jgi:hypothetical protein